MSNRAQISSLLESITALALKLGLVMLGLSTAYLLYVLFGGKLATVANKADQASLEQLVGMAKLILMLGSLMVVAACCIRFYLDETVGLLMTLAGGVLHFLAPAGINALAPDAIHKSTTYLSILQQISSVGLVCLIPGCILLLRSIVMQLARIAERQALPKVAEDSGRLKPRRTKNIYANCWAMPQCNDHAKRICPAWSRRRPCWQIKAGCLCDQDVIRRAMVERDRDQGADTSAGPKVATQPKVVLTAAAKRERCRACTIYSEHQRQKFRIASPLTIVAVLVVYGFVYGRVSGWLYSILGKTDGFMSLLSYNKGAEGSFATHGHTVTTLAMMCLGVVLISMSLKLLEYVIYELQA